VNAPHLRLVPTDAPRELASFEGRPPPNDMDAEGGVIGALFVDATVVLPQITFLQPEHFYSNAHMRIFHAVRTLEVTGTAIGLLSVWSQIKASGRGGEVGGLAYLHEISNAAFNHRHASTYAATVYDLWRVRCVLAAALEVQAYGYLRRYELVQSFVDDAARTMLDISRREVGKARESNLEVLRRMMQNIQAKAAGGGRGPAGIPTGFRGIDDRIGGLHSGHKITIAAQPGRGKTTIGLQIARSVAEMGIGVLYFSAEQTHEELLFKLLSAAASVSFMQIKSGHLSERGWFDVTQDTTKLAKLPLWFETSPSMHVDEIRSSALRQASERVGSDAPLGLVVVDHLHRLVPPPTRNGKMDKNQHVAADTKALKKLAQELGVPLIELAQQKALDSKAQDARPGDNCVAWSYEVEREADDLVYLHCTDKTKPYRTFDAIVHKSRFGEPGDVPLLLEGEFSRFKVAGEDEYR
jgi:replicative DNA helicase